MTEVASRLLLGDCTEIMLQESGWDVPPDLIVADPPYDYGQQYEGYDDNRGPADYEVWMRNWMAAADVALSPRGTIWIVVPDEWAAETKLHGVRGLGWTFRSWVVWYFTFGQAGSRNFARSKTHLMYFVKDPEDFTWEDDAVRVPSARLAVYGDKRANRRGKQPDNVWMLLRDQMEQVLQPDQDVWLESRVCGTFGERRRHSPNQLPEALVRRMVLATSRPGDHVLDPFCGTGTTGVVCRDAGRRFTGIDISEATLRNAAERIGKPCPQ